MQIIFYTLITKKRTVLNEGVKSHDINSSISNNIPQNNKNVKDTSSTKYSIKNKENNTQELDNSSFSFGNLPKVKDGYTRLYRGLKNEYNPNYDRTSLDSPNGYDTLTDSYELAKRYGDKVYYIDIPTDQIGDSVIDENPNSETYGDRYLAYKDENPASLDRIKGNEYLLYTDHDNFNENWFVFGGIYPLVDNTISLHQTNCEKKAKVKHIRLHDFRHSCASLLINNGASISLVAKYLGHSKISTTLDTYTHLFKNELDDIIKVINNLEK